MNKKIKLVLGTMTFGESVFHPDVEAFIQTFLDAGYEELDTAYVYNEGRCEALLGEVKMCIRDRYYVEHISFFLDVRMVLKTIKIMFSKSEMRTNSDRIKFNGTNLNETRPRHEIIKAEAEAAEVRQ